MNFIKNNHYFALLALTASLMLMNCQSAYAQFLNQNKTCGCENDAMMTENTVSCEPTYFDNGSKMYWQFNCDAIWLTLENANGNKRIIDHVDPELYNYTYRLGYHLIREYRKALLFRNGCGAGGPCLYTLVDKNTGKTIEKFSQLIAIDDPNSIYAFNIVVEYLENKNALRIYSIENRSSFEVKLQQEIHAIVPAYQFTNMQVEYGILSLNWITDTEDIQQIDIDLTTKKEINQ